jgi:hypothetical protein
MNLGGGDFIRLRHNHCIDIQSVLPGLRVKDVDREGLSIDPNDNMMRGRMGEGYGVPLRESLGCWTRG